MADESFESVLSGVKQQAEAQQPSPVSAAPVQPMAAPTPNQESPEFSQVLQNVKKQAQNPSAPPQEAGQPIQTESQIQQSLQKKIQLHAEGKDTLEYVNSNIVTRTVSAMVKSAGEGISDAFFNSGNEPLTEGQKRAFPTDTTSKWINTINAELMRPLVGMVANNGDVILGKVFAPVSIPFGAVTGGIENVANETDSKVLRDAVSTLNDPTFQAQMAVGFGGAPHPDAGKIRELVTKPPLADHVYEAVNNGILPDAPPDIKQEAAQAVAAKQKAAYMEKQKGLVEVGQPPPNIHLLAAKIEPEAVAASRAAEARQQTLRDSIQSIKDELPAQSPYATELEQAKQNVEVKATKKNQARLDDLTEKHESWINDQATNNPQIAALREGIQSLDEVRRNNAEKVSSAYRQAAEQMPKDEAKPVEKPKAAEPEKAPEPVAAKTPEQEKAAVSDHQAIVDDIVKQATAKGYGEGEAKASAEILAKTYGYFADLYKGAKGSALDLYKSQGAGIIGHGEKWLNGKVLNSAKGQYNAALRLIRLMKGADGSTLVHEGAHHFMNMMTSMSEEEGAPEKLKSDMKEIRDWLGVKDGDDLARKHEEKFARGFERYLMEGHAPTKELIPIFQKFEQWLKAIYDTVKNIPQQGGGISPAIRNFFDRMMEPNEALRDNPREAIVAKEPTEFKPEPKKERPQSIAMKLPQKPLSLSEWVSKNGGLNISDADLKGVGAEDWHKGKPGWKKIQQETGMSMDDAAEAAQEEGYFDDIKGRRPSIAEFMNKLRDDATGNHQYKVSDAGKMDEYNNAVQFNAQADEYANKYDIDTKGMTRKQFWDAVREKMSIEDADKEAQDRNDAALHEIDEFERKEKEFMESRGDAWEPESSETRTLEDLENEYKQTQDAGNIQQGISGTKESEPAAVGTGVGKEGEGQLGGGTGANEPTTERRGTSPVPPATVGESPIIGKDGKIDTSSVEKIGHQEFLKRYNAELLRSEQDGTLAKKFSFEDTVKLADLRAIAEQMNMTVDQMKNIQTDYGSLTERPILRAGAYILMKQLHEEMIVAAKDAIASGKAENMAEFLKTYDKRDQLLNAYKTTESLSKEAGVHLVASKIIEAIDVTGAKETGAILYQMEQMEREGKGSPNGLTKEDLDKMTELANMIGKSDNTADVANILKNVNKPTFWDKLREVQVVMLTSGLVTHASYFLGGLPLNLFKSGIEDTLTAVVDKLRSTVGFESAGDKLTQGLRGILDQIIRMPNTLSATGTAVTEGRTVLLPREEYTPKDTLFANIRKTTAVNPEVIKQAVADNFKEEKFPDLVELREKLDAAVAKGDVLAAGRLTSKLDVEIARKKAILEKHFTTEIQSRLKTWGEIASTSKDFMLSQAAGLRQMAKDKSSGTHGVPLYSALKFETQSVYGGIHTFQRYSIMAGELRAECRRSVLADAEKHNENLAEKDIDLRTDNLMKAPTQAVMDKVTKTANELSFMNSNSAYVRRLNGFLSVLTPWNIPLGKIIAPITTVPTNIAAELLKRTPILGTALKDVREDLSGKNGITAQNKAIARQLSGLSVIVTGYILAQNNAATPSSSINHKHDEQKIEAGQQPGSIKVGDSWVDISTIPVLSNLLTLGADLHSIRNIAVGDDESETLRAAAFSAARNFALHENAMVNLSDMMDAVTGKSSLENYLKNLASSVTAPALVSQFNQDPYQREAKTLIDKLKNKVQETSETLQPKISPVTGEILNRRQGEIPGTRFYQASTAADPIAAKLTAIGFYPANPEPQINGVDLTPQQGTEFSVVKAHILYNGMQMLMQGDGKEDFDAANTPDKRKMAIKIETHATQCAKSYMFNKYPGILKDANDKYEASCRGEDYNYSPP